ncbi:MAG TPA: glycosyltransferase family 1 protein [Chromatiales bacterium]|nr:glycosyltransferase family 1 protein [Chromatiales bacterium]
MKIMILCTSAGVGGLELYAEREWRSMNESGHTCYFVGRDKGPLAQRIEAAGGGETALLLRPHWKVLPLVNALRLARYIDAHGIDIIHLHWVRDLALGVLAQRFSKCRPKLVYSRHMGITRPKKDRYHRFFYSKIDRLLVVSRQVQKEALRYLPLPPERITLLYLGVPAADRSEPQECSALLPEKFTKRPFRIGMFGRIEHGKGQHLLVEAMAKLVNEGFEGGALIIGHVMDEDYFEQLKKRAEDGAIEEHITFAGFTESPQQVMSCCDVVVLLTYCETFGLVLVEAMRQGVAVIGTDAGGVPEIISHEESGLLIPPGDADALADSLRRLYEDEPLKQQLAENGKRNADEKFDERLHFDKLNTIFLEMNGAHQQRCSQKLPGN